MAGIRTITAITSPNSRVRLAAAPVVALNIILAALLVAVGVRGMVADSLRLPSEVAIHMIKDGQPISDGDDKDAVERLEKASNLSNAAHSDLALALLANNSSPGSAIDKVAADHAVRQLRIYLESTPDDPLAWENLALAEMRRGTIGGAVVPYKMSIELAPASVTALLWRCGFGLDIYPLLDDDGKATVARQFQMAMDPSLDQSIPESIVKVVATKNAVPLVRTFLASDQSAGQRFESMLALKR